MLNQTNNNLGLLTGENPVISAFAQVQQGSPTLFNSMNKICGIYKITNPKGKIYIGQSVDCERRKSHYKMGHHKKQSKLYNSTQKYGWAAHKFEIIHRCEVHELNDLEVYYIGLFQCFNTNHGLNLMSGGYGNGKMSEETKLKMSKQRKGRKQSPAAIEKIRMFHLGRKRSKETCDNIGISLKGKSTWNKGKTHTEETKAKMRKPHKKFSEATKLKMSIYHTGKKLPQETINKMLLARQGYKHSDETKKKISESQKGNMYAFGKKHNEATKDKIRQSTQKRWDSSEFFSKVSL